MIAQVIIALALIAAFAVAVGCGGDSSPSAPSGDSRPVSPSQPAAAFADSNLEAAVRAALGQLTDTLSADTVFSLESLSARGRGIADLDGIEQLRRLKALDLADNRIADLSPLVGLTRLEFLDLTANQIQDLSPLAGLDSLQSLALDFNPVHDLSSLLSLDRLQWLEVLGVPLSEEAEQRQIPALRQRGVEIALSPSAMEDAQGPRPDSQSRIAFISKRGVPDGEHGYRLYTVHPDGSDLKKLNDLTFVDRPRLSPHHGKLVFAYDPDYLGPALTDIYVSGIDGSDLRNITSDRSIRLLQNRPGVYYEPFWSPNGDQVGFRASAYGLLRVNADGTDVRLFFQHDDLNHVYLVAASHQWDRVAVLSGDGAAAGTYGLFISNADGTDRRLVVDAVLDRKAPEYLPYYLVWSPDDQKIAFVSNRDGNRELYVVNVDGSNLARLTNDDSVDAACVWSPDGHWLAFDTNREVKWEVFVTDVEGKNTYNLTQSFIDNYVCGWLSGE